MGSVFSICGYWFKVIGLIARDVLSILVSAVMYIYMHVTCYWFIYTCMSHVIGSYIHSCHMLLVHIYIHVTCHWFIYTFMSHVIGSCIHSCHMLLVRLLYRICRKRPLGFTFYVCKLQHVTCHSGLCICFLCMQHVTFCASKKGINILCMQHVTFYVCNM